MINLGHLFILFKIFLDEESKLARVFLVKLMGIESHVMKSGILCQLFSCSILHEHEVYVYKAMFVFLEVRKTFSTGVKETSVIIENSVRIVARLSKFAIIDERS